MLCTIIVKHLESFQRIRWDLDEVIVSATGADPTESVFYIHDCNGPGSTAMGLRRPWMQV